MDLRRPLIVCGMPRSGTTLIGQLMKSGDTDLDRSISYEKEHVRIYPELNPGRLVAQFDLIETIGDVLGAMAWRLEFDDDTIAARKLELLRAIWRTGRPATGAPDEGHERFGLKQPGGELFYTQHQQALGSVSPIFVYCLRSPGDVYRSNLETMGSWGDVSPRRFLHKYRKSLTAIERFEPEDVFVFDVDLASTDLDTRRSLTRSLFAFCEVEYTHRTERFVTDWPAVNRGSRKGIESLDATEVNQRVDRFNAKAGNLVTRSQALVSSV